MCTTRKGERTMNPIEIIGLAVAAVIVAPGHISLAVMGIVVAGSRPAKQPQRPKRRRDSLVPPHPGPGYVWDSGVHRWIKTGATGRDPVATYLAADPLDAGVALL